MILPSLKKIGWMVPSVGVIRRIRTTDAVVPIFHIMKKRQLRFALLHLVMGRSWLCFRLAALTRLPHLPQQDVDVKTLSRSKSFYIVRKRTAPAELSFVNKSDLLDIALLPDLRKQHCPFLWCTHCLWRRKVSKEGGSEEKSFESDMPAVMSVVALPNNRRLHA